jgi:hypothetical protein
VLFGRSGTAWRAPTEEPVASDEGFDAGIIVMGSGRCNASWRARASWSGVWVCALRFNASIWASASLSVALRSRSRASAASRACFCVARVEARRSWSSWAASQAWKTSAARRSAAQRAAISIVRRVVTGMGAMKHEARKHGSRELTERVVPCCWIALCVAWVTCVAPTVLRIAIACGGARVKAAFSSPACCRRSCAAGPWRRGRLLEPPLLSEKGEER